MGLCDRIVGTGHPNRWVLVQAVVVLLLALIPGGLRAQTSAPPRPPEVVALSGEVRDVNPLTVRVDGQDRRLRTAANVVVVRAGADVTLEELRVGDRVSFTTNADNLVQQVTVTKVASDDTHRSLLIGLVVFVLVAAAVLLWYLTRRQRDRDARGRTGTSRSTRDELG